MHGAMLTGFGGTFCVILIHFISLNYIMESPYHAIKTVTGSHCSLQTLCTRLDYSVAVSAQSYQSVIVRQFYHRVVSGVRMDAQTPASWSHTRVKTLACVLG